MKKLVAIGASTLVLAMLPVAGAFAVDTTTQTDTITITVSSHCELLRGATAHTNGDGTWSSNTLSKTMSNSSYSYNLGKSTFNAVCNNGSGYKVTVKTLNNLTSGSYSIPAYTGASSGAGAAYTASVSGWSPIQAPSSGTPTASTQKYKQGDTVKTAAAATSGTEFSVFYGVGVSSTQQAGTYSGTVVYEIATLSS